MFSFFNCICLSFALHYMIMASEKETIREHVQCIMIRKVFWHTREQDQIIDIKSNIAKGCYEGGEVEKWSRKELEDRLCVRDDPISSTCWNIPIGSTLQSHVNNVRTSPNGSLTSVL